MKNSFQFVEHYIEFIAGYRDENGAAYGLFNERKPPINLARYDMGLIDNLANQTLDRKLGYTDRQAELARKIVSKYKRQLSNLTPAIEAPTLDEFLPFRIPIRNIDRSRIAYIEDGKFVIKFPFETNLINALKAQVKEGAGGGHWAVDKKVWMLAMTESNLSWIMAMRETYNLELSDKVSELCNLLTEKESTGFKIELTETDQGLEITNAPRSLTDYIDEHIGGLNLDNLLSLIDYSGILGYTVSESLLARLNIDDSLKPWVNNRMFTVDVTNDNEVDEGYLDRILEYAKLTNRLPVYLYQGQTITSKAKDNQDIILLTRDSDIDIKPKLLVTTTGFMIGHRRARWLQNAEKVAIINDASNTTDQR